VCEIQLIKMHGETVKFGSQQLRNFIILTF